jgi:uncharacterized caspase-like protein
MQNDYAIIVGISDYPASSLRQLKGPINDAIAFRNWVTADDGGAVPDNGTHIKQKTSVDFAPAASPSLAQPSRDDVIRLFDEVMDTLEAIDEQGRRLYVFFAGHGCSPTNATALRNASLLMANANLPRRPHNLPGNLIAEHMRTAAYFREVVLIMDCCRDEMSNAPLLNPWPPIAEPGADGKLVTAYATAWASKARERDFAGQDRGIFSYSLMEVLKSGQIDGEMLKASVPAHIELSTDRPVKQESQFAGDLAEIRFSEAAPIPQSNVTVDIRGNGEVAEIWTDDPDSDDLKQVKQFQLGDAPWQGELAPGNYLLESTAVGLRKHFTVYAAVATVINSGGGVQDE